jgi:PAS domain S-box-containing protein
MVVGGNLMGVSGVRPISEISRTHDDGVLESGGDAMDPHGDGPSAGRDILEGGGSALGADGDVLDAVARLLEVVGSQPLSLQLNNLALFVERLSTDMRCSIQLIDPKTGALHFGAAPHLPSAYNAAIDGIVLGEGVGSCGTAAARRSMVIVSDIEQSPLWRDYRDLARAHRIAACWSTPVIDSQGELLGTFAMYYREPRQPNAAELKVLQIAGPLAAVVIQRHRDVQRLRESEERFRSAFDFAAIGKAMVSPDGRWLRVNEALCGIVGYSAEELLRTNFQSITYAHDLGRDLHLMREMLDGKRTYYELEKRYVHKAGYPIWILLSVSLIRDECGKPLYFISQIQDISERKRLEGAVRETTSSEQERLGRDLHDGLGQELTGLSLLAGAFATKAQRLGSPLAADALALSDIARNAVATCRDIVRGVSPLTESQGGLVKGIHQLTSRAAEIGGHTVGFTADEGAPVRLSWDSRNQLYRIIQEALNNAVTHSNAENIDVSVVIDARAVRVKIADNGKGYRADAKRAGLGVETMRYRAAALHARLLVETTPGGGTTVICECPQPPAADASDGNEVPRRVGSRPAAADGL